MVERSVVKVTCMVARMDHSYGLAKHTTSQTPEITNLFKSLSLYVCFRYTYATMGRSSNQTNQLTTVL
jgi:hypothetical protein